MTLLLTSLMAFQTVMASASAVTLMALAHAPAHETYAARTAPDQATRSHALSHCAQKDTPSRHADGTKISSSADDRFRSKSKRT